MTTPITEETRTTASLSLLDQAMQQCGVIRSVADVEPFDLAEDAETLVIRAQLLTVDGAESFATGGQLIVSIKRMIRAVETHYKRYKDPINALRRELLDMEGADLSPLEQAKTNLEPQIAKFDLQQKQGALAEQRRLQAIEDQRALDEQKAAAASVQRVAEATEDPRSKKALVQEAKAILAAPAVSRKVAAPATVKVQGLSVRTEPRAEIVDPMVLLRCIIAGKLPISVIEPERLKLEHPALDAMAKAMGGKLETLCAGVKVVEKPIVSGR